MTVNYTTLLALGQPVTGSETGTWGDDVNNAVTSYLDIAIAGTLSLTSANFTAGALTLANTQGTSSATNIASTTAQYANIKVSSLAQASTITVPSSSRTYRVLNADSTYNLTIKASGQVGYTLTPGTQAILVFNGTDYVLAQTSPIAVTASMNLYVRTDGSDSNSGFANTAGGAFLTIQHALDVAANYFAGLYDITINIADGTYAESLGRFPGVAASTPGYGVKLLGNTGTPANVVISSIYPYNCAVDIAGVSCVDVYCGFSYVQITSSALKAVVADNAAYVSLGGSANTFAGNTASAIRATNGGQVEVHSLTLSGTPVYSNAFLSALRNGIVTVVVGSTITGSATGVTAYADSTGVVITNGVSLPGSGYSGFTGGLITGLPTANTGSAAYGVRYGDKFGYQGSIGTGGAQTQITSKSTTVVLNTPTGEITMNNATLNAATIVSFTLTNSSIEGGDVMILNHSSGGTIGAYTLNASCGSGSATIYVRNATAGNLGEAIVIRYAVVRGATT